MTRIVFWNIENFGINKIDDPSTAVSTGQGGLQDNAASAERLLIIESVVLTANPDILIVVEVCSGMSAPGTLITPTGGAQGCRRLLQALRVYAADWRLVPPLTVGNNGMQEGVAVYYRGNAGGGRTRYFTGPNFWLGAASGAPGGAGTVAYPAPWTPTLGPTRVVPPGSAHNPNMIEDELAARVVPVVYPLAAGPFVANNREPYYCTFFETGGGVADRNLALFALHTSPWTAAAYLTAAAPAIAAQAVVAAETRIVAGDFNVNLLDGGGAFAAPYAAFGGGYQPLLSMPAGYPGGVAPSLASYCSYATTHIKPRKIFGHQCATFMSTGTAPVSYPGLGYAGAAFGADAYSIDNMLISPVPGGGALAAMGTTVINIVTGTPYTVLAGLAGTVPPGTLAVPCYFNTTPGGFPWNAGAGVAANFAAGTNTTLLSWANYGRIRSTSDHFAIYANV